MEVICTPYQTKYSKMDLVKPVEGTLLFSSREGRTRDFSSECKTGEAGFTDWMSFPPSDLMKNINRNPIAFRANTKSL